MRKKAPKTSVENPTIQPTPGPWKVEQLPINPNEVYIVGRNGRSVAYVIHNDDERKEQIPDAHLIAAAPEMLETLRMAEQLLHNILIGNSSRQEVDEKVPFITATIIKATCPELINETRSNP